MGHGRLSSILWFKLSSRNRFFPPITHPKIPVRTIQTFGLETIRKNSQILQILANSTCYLFYGVEQNIKGAFLRRDVLTDLSCGGAHKSIASWSHGPNKGTVCWESEKKATKLLQDMLLFDLWGVWPKPCRPNAHTQKDLEAKGIHVACQSVYWLFGHFL
jgi:hypothetical protein